MKNFGNVLWGIVLIVVGIVIGGNALGITNINIFFDGWWTLFIIVPCFIGLFKERAKTGNLIGLGIGVALLLCCLDILNFDLVWKLALPVVLVIIGISLVFKDTFDHEVSEKIKNLNKNSNSDKGSFAAFSGQKVSYDKEKFNGTELTAVFGGIECDLRDAIIENDVVINASSIFGGIEIIVPSNVKIKIKSSSIFGGVGEKRKNTDAVDKEHTIYINATCMFGGVEIK